MYVCMFMRSPRLIGSSCRMLHSKSSSRGCFWAQEQSNRSTSRRTHFIACICMHMHTHAYAYACICMHMHAYACICMHHDWAGTHVCLAGTHMCLAGTHMCLAGTHMCLAGTHMCLAGTHIWRMRPEAETGFLKSYGCAIL